MTAFTHSPAAADTGTAGSLLLTDFTASTPDLGWYVVNDNVMGGRSDGGFELEQETLVFAGNTNTRGGGFSSIRTGALELDLSSQAGINGTWATVDIPFDAFVPQFRGYRLDGPALDTSKIQGMGLMIYDKQDGRFRLHLESIRAYGPSTQE